MSIVSKLLDGLTDGSHDLLYPYGCYSAEVQDFLETPTPFDDRQKRAIAIVKQVLAAHGKETLLDQLSLLAKVEHGIGELQPWARDHVVHAVLTFVLGAYLNERFFRPGHRVDPFQWKLSGLLHDVAYPIQIARQSVIQPFEHTINKIRKDFDLPGRDVRFLVVPENLERLSNNVDGFDLLQGRMDQWELSIDARRVYHSMLESGSLCHGMLSALAILLALDLMYQKHNPTRADEDTYLGGSNVNWSERYFQNDIVSACTAVFIHNLDGKYFNSAKIRREKAPLAFLLRLSDCLQDWERPSLCVPDGVPANRYSIAVENDKLLFECPAHRKDKIGEQLEATLEAADVIVR